MFKNYQRSYLKKDIVSGIVVALISIPISMGYAQVAGLPVVYGLYGSLLPIIVFGLLSSSPQFVFGVDAAPAALVGGTIASLGITTGSEEAMRVVPVITLVTAGWLLLFALLKAGRLVNYISKPVLGGFISGIGCTIILMQVAKLFGGSAGTGEVFVLLGHIISELREFHLLSFIMGVSTIVIVWTSKKIAPKFPMSVVMLVAGALSTILFHVDRYGVKLLPQVEAGLPKWILPDVSVLAEYPEDILMIGLTVALVIVSSTLLTARNYAIKNDYKIQNNREIVAYAAANLCAAFQGCCPLNGSVSRTAIAEQFGVRTQVMSIVAGLTMMLVLLVGTPLIAYLPVPVLTGIVISALMSIVEGKMAKQLWKTDKTEFAIFLSAFLGVLILGTLYGVIIGVLLSFGSVIYRASVPPRAKLGVIPGQAGFFDLERCRNAHAIRNTVIYRFSGSLFFANIGTFQEDIEQAITEDTRIVIVDGSGIGTIDITAAERLLILEKKLESRGIQFYLTGHVGAVNDQLRQLGASEMIERGKVRRTISLALRDAGVEKPYPLEDRDGISPLENIWEANEELAEFEWIFGEEAAKRMEKLAEEVAQQMVSGKDEEEILEAERHTSWGRIGLFDENELLDRLEMHLNELSEHTHQTPEQLLELLEKRRMTVEHKLEGLNPAALEMLRKHHENLEERMKKEKPELYEQLQRYRKKNL
ncbi:MAG: SulP family inorganic anion transporter [Lachnospiraceae bacterium]